MNMIYREFLDNGFRIFGLHGAGPDGRCGCGNPRCEAVYKHPIASNWQHTPEWSDEQIECMEMSGQLDTGYGVLVGGHLLVVDVDARNGGVASWQRLCEDIPALQSPDFLVETGSGGGSVHSYYIAPEGAALAQKLEAYPGVDFKSSGYVVGPGSLHASGNRYRAVIGSPADIQPAPAALVELLKKPERFRASLDGHAVDVSMEEIADMLAALDGSGLADDYEAWVRVGMAIHHATGGAGFDLWDKWSQQSAKYQKGMMPQKWHSFGKSANPVTLGTLVHYAADRGWVRPVTFQAAGVDFSAAEVPAVSKDKSDLPFPISSVDLKRPPGFVGDVTRWINSQCRFPRENMAVIGAIVAMGNVAGLRYIDDTSDATANIFAFCVAGSATGKEAIQQAIMEIHGAAGIHGATYGSIKSEQEIVRNLTRHQAALYVIDELGILLKKILNSGNSGASYLEGVIGELMKVYSKADGLYLLTGDMKEALRSGVMSDIKSAQKLADGPDQKAADYARARIEALQKSLDDIEMGLRNPFLSLIGFSTPSTFNGLATADQATNGFLGRALIFEERETNPKPKPGFKRLPMPESMKMTIQQVFSGGSYDLGPAAGRRIEGPAERIPIATDAEARSMMDAASHWLFHELAERHKETSGLEAIVRRGYEMLAKVSLILAAPSGVRTAEHVRWAFALMLRDIGEKIRVVTENEEHTVDGLSAKILGVISAEHAETVAVIVNRCKKYKRDDVLRCLSELEKAGRVEKIVEQHKQSAKKVLEKWRALE